MSEHDVQVGPAMKLDARGLMQASCTCGWRGMIGTQIKATVSGEMHVSMKRLGGQEARGSAEIAADEAAYAAHEREVDQVKDGERVVATLRLPAPAAELASLIAPLEKMYGPDLRSDFQGQWMRILLPAGPTSTEQQR